MNNTKEDLRKIWFVAFPLFQYKGGSSEVKVLARKNDLKIVDARFEKSFDPKCKATEVPKLVFIEKAKTKSEK